ncbi:MAG: polysaccharide export protein [Oceanococcus sp.]|nr:MAG: polysaccharide export protein [Oceanococcus sp.]
MPFKTTSLLAALASCVALLAGCASTPPPPSQTATSQAAPSSSFQASVYRLNIGDRVQIKVFQESDLSGDFTIESDGKINYPLLGRVPVSGTTTADLERSIKKGLAQGFLVSPDVRATVVAYKPIFVGGEVKSPGEYPFTPGLTAQQAATVAGGLTRFAAEKYYIQRNASGPDQRFRATPDTFVYPGDIVTIEERLF